MAAVRVSWGEKPVRTCFLDGAMPVLKSSTWARPSGASSMRSALAVTVKGPRGVANWAWPDCSTNTWAPPERRRVSIPSTHTAVSAAIVARGGFKEVGARPPGDLVYVRVTGRDPAGEEIAPVAGEPDADALPEITWAGLETLVRRYEDEDHPYRSRTAPQFVKTYASDYDHLARVGEWAAAEEEGE